MASRGETLVDGPITVRLNFSDADHLSAVGSNHGHVEGNQPHASFNRQTSDAASSISTISDLGLDAAPTPFSMPRCDCTPLGKAACSVLDDDTGHYMGAEELGRHLGLEDDLKPNVTESVRNWVWQRLKSHKTPDDIQKEFLPINTFEEIFCKECIKSLVKESEPEMTQEDLGNKIKQVYQVDNTGKATSHRRILGILTMIPALQYLDQFIEQGVSDGDLPINIHDPFFNDWDITEKTSFGTYQHWFFVPFFNFQADVLSSYSFAQDITLPWVQYERKSAGNFGMVYQVQIHPDHHNFTGHAQSTKTQSFALKEIHASNRESYKTELSALEKTFGKTQNEKHLIKLLLTFQHGERFFLIFEWADGNLEEFWGQEAILQGDLDDRWASCQLLGVAKALRRIHGLSTMQKESRKTFSDGASDDGVREFGRHGDVKATNILWFQKYENDAHLLVLSDLGLTTYHSYATQSRVRHSQLAGLTPKYRPPEFDLHIQISSKYDIWSLGCVYFEFLIWYLLGKHNLEDFSIALSERNGLNSCIDEDNFFNIQEGPNGQLVPYVKVAVKEWTDKMLAQPRCSPFARRMLELITEKMLVVNVKQRWKMDRICTEMIAINESTVGAGAAGHQPGPEPRRRHVPARDVYNSTPSVPDTDLLYSISPSRATADVVQHAQGTWGDTEVSWSRSSSFTSNESQRPPQALFDVLKRADQLFLSDIEDESQEK